MSPDSGPKKSWLAHRTSLSWLVSAGVKRKKGAPSECGSSHKRRPQLADQEPRLENDERRGGRQSKKARSEETEPS
jgi:hypothetical protein